MADGEVEILLMISRPDVNRDAKAKLVNPYINIKEGV